MSHFSKYLLSVFFMVAIVAIVGRVQAAEVHVTAQGEDSVIAAAVQADFAGSEAAVSAPDASTIEIAVAGADFSVDGKRQLFRFEDAAIKTVSVTKSGSKGIVRFNLKEKNAARVADMIRVTRADGHLFVEVPVAVDSSAQSIAGTKVISIAPGPSKIEASAPGVVTEDAIKTASLTVGEAAPAKTDAKASPKSDSKAETKSEEASIALVKDKRPESEIPVFADKAEVKKAGGSSLERLMITLAVVCAILGAALFGLKRWAARRGKNVSSPTKINILTQHHLGPKKSLAIIQVAGEAILIGITDQNISMLKTLALIDDEVPGVVPKNFSDELDNEESTAEAARQLAEEGYEEEDNFALRGLSEVRDMVSTRLGGRSRGRDA